MKLRSCATSYQAEPVGGQAAGEGLILSLQAGLLAKYELLLRFLPGTGGGGPAVGCWIPVWTVGVDLCVGHWVKRASGQSLSQPDSLRESGRGGY